MKQNIFDMRKQILFIGFNICLLISAFSQSDSIPVQADIMPYFQGCENLSKGSTEKRNCSNKALVNFIAQNLETPKVMTSSGVVYINFVVTEMGIVKYVSVLRGLESAQNEAAMQVVKAMPAWQPALLNNQPVEVKMTLPIRFKQTDDSDLSNGFQVTWGNLKGKKLAKTELLKTMNAPISVRDETGNLLEINELMFERERDGKFSDAQSNGSITEDMQKLIKKLKSGDTFTMTVTVQKKGQFFYVDKRFEIEN
jgi:Gram-negative bacterial TonB protein C-terminal